MYVWHLLQYPSYQTGKFLFNFTFLVALVVTYVSLLLISAISGHMTIGGYQQKAFKIYNTAVTQKQTFSRAL